MKSRLLMVISSSSSSPPCMWVKGFPFDHATSRMVGGSFSTEQIGKQIAKRALDGSATGNLRIRVRYHAPLERAHPIFRCEAFKISWLARAGSPVQRRALGAMARVRAKKNHGRMSRPWFVCPGYEKLELTA